MANLTDFLIAFLVFSLFMLYLMYVRMRQLRNELDELRDRVAITGEELMRLSNDIEDFKKIKI